MSPPEGAPRVPDPKPEKLSRFVTKRFVDMRTGEEVELGSEEAIKRRPAGKQKSVEPFGLWFPEALTRLAAMGLSNNDWRVLAQLLAWTPFEEHTGYSATDLSNKLGIHRNHVSRSVRKLRDLGVLLPGGGPRRVWVNPEYFWRGSLSGRIKVLHMLQERKKSNAASPHEEDGSHDESDH